MLTLNFVARVTEIRPQTWQAHVRGALNAQAVKEASGAAANPFDAVRSALALLEKEYRADSVRPGRTVMKLATRDGERV